MEFIREAEQVVQKYADAIHSLDGKRLRSVWTCENTNILISGSKLFRGIDEICDVFLEQLIGGRYSSIYLINDGLEAYQLGGDTGIVVFRYHTDCILRENGDRHGIAGLETQVLKKTDGEWKIAHIKYHGKEIRF